MRFFLAFLILLSWGRGISQGAAIYTHQSFDLLDGLSQMKVSAICEDEQGYIWVGTRNGLNRFDGREFLVFTTEDGLPNNRIHDIKYNPIHGLIVLTSKGLSLHNGSVFLNYLYDFPRVQYKIIVIDDKIFILDGERNLKFENGEFINIDLDKWEDSDHVFSEYPSHIKEDLSGYYYDNGKVRDTVLVHPKPRLIHPSYWFIDKYDNVWIGSENGLHLFQERIFEQIDQIQLPYIWGMAETDSSYWFVSYGFGLFEMNKSNSQIVKHAQEESFKHYHHGIAIDEVQNVYFSNNYCLLKYDGEIFECPYGKTHTFGAKYDTSRSRLVYGILNGIRWDNLEGGSEVITDSTSIHPNNYIMSITIDESANYWCGSYKGLTKYNPDTKESNIYTSTNERLPASEGVFTGFLDSQSTLWFGGEKGLIYFSKIENKLIPINSILIETQIKGINQIDDETLILATPNELILFNFETYLRTGKVVTQSINRSNGYYGIEPTFDGIFKDSKQNIWILSASSIDILKSDKQLPDFRPMNLRINKVNGVTLPYCKSDRIDTSFIINQNQVSIDLDAIGLSRPTAILYSYRLDGNEWSFWQESDNLQINDLHHGLHKIDFKIGPHDDVNIHKTASFFLNINLPVYKRFYFMPFLGLLLFLGLVSMFYFLYKSYSNQKKYISQLTESKYLKSQLLLTEMNPHFIFNVLASIQNKIIKGDKETANKKLIQLSTLIRNFLNVSYRSNQVKNKFETDTSLNKEIELLSFYIDFEQSISNNHFYTEVILKDIPDPSLIMLPPMIIQPYVENAIKHGLLPKDEIGQLKITFEQNHERLLCTIQDDGAGMDIENLIYSSKLQHKSLGTTLVNERVRLLNELGYNIKLETKSELGVGTRVFISIYEKN